MSTHAPSIPSHARAGIPNDYVWQLSVQRYHEMVRSGSLGDNDPIELLNGWLILKMPKNPPHRAATRMVQQELQRITPPGYYVDGQEPITLADSEPEPDAVIVRGTTRDYLDRHPGAADVELVVEVADSTLERDRTLKKTIYASAGIAVYWVLDLINRQLEVYQDPFGSGEAADYRSIVTYRSGESVELTVGGRRAGQIAVSEILP